MDADELLRRLNLKPTTSQQKGEKVDPIETEDVFGQQKEEKSVSPFALELNLFEQAQGDKLQRHNFRIRDTKVEAEALSDLHAMAFLSEPTLSEQECVDPRRAEFVRNLFETPSYHSLKKSTEHDPVASEMATLEFAQSFAKLKETDKRQEEECRKKGQNPNSERQKTRSEINCLKAAGKAIQEAEKEVSDYKEMRHALGMGPGKGENTKLEAAKVGELFERIKNSERLRKIFEKAGPARRVAESNRKKQTLRGYDDLVGVKMDGDLSKLLPHELGYLTMPETEDDALRRLVEKQSMCRDYRGVEQAGKGPFVFCVDESGSMSCPYDNPHIVQAKAIALAIAYNARHENRFCVLIGYSGGTEGTKLVLPPGKWNAEALLDFLEHNFDGGTQLDIPLVELPLWWDDFVKQGMPRGQTDLFLVSDAICHVPEEMEKSFLAWKQREKVKCTSLILARDAGGLAGVSDEVHLLRDLSLEQDAIQKILSV